MIVSLPTKDTLPLNVRHFLIVSKAFPVHFVIRFAHAIEQSYFIHLLCIVYLLHVFQEQKLRHFRGANV